MPKYTIFAVVLTVCFNVSFLLASDMSEGFKWVDLKEYKKAVYCFNEALKKDQDNNRLKENLVFSYHQLANQYAEGSMWQMAIDCENKALDLDPDNQTIRQTLSVYYNNFALSKFLEKDTRQVINYLKKALQYDSSSIKIKENISSYLVQEAKKEYDKKNLDEAFNLLKESLTFNDKNCNAYGYLGEIFYSRDNLKQAVEHWKKALELNPAIKHLEERITKAEKETNVEGGFNIQEIKNFRVKFEGYKNIDIAWKILRILEDARYKIGADFRFYPGEPITVIIYTSDQFRDVTNFIDSIMGVYDGKIRVKVNDLIRDEEVLKKILYHEYTHALIHEITKGNIPVWLNEGIAQFKEPQKNVIFSENIVLKSFIENGKLIGLSRLENIFIEKNDEEKLKIAYLETKSFVYYIANRYGDYSLYKLLEILGKNHDFESAVNKVFYKEIKQLEEEWHIYLKQN